MNEDPAEYLALLLGQPKLVPDTGDNGLAGTRHYRAVLTGAKDDHPVRVLTPVVAPPADQVADFDAVLKGGS
ncbi:hypothetical protein ABZW32_21460 [Streptomyces sp. NPDC004667]|uniref:hypothetical protein n=1 Tax=Streptomyces sp. NPDC004667 TaxID=3154285 RepID=UPI0033AC2C55